MVFLFWLGYVFQGCDCFDDSHSDSKISYAFCVGIMILIFFVVLILVSICFNKINGRYYLLNELYSSSCGDIFFNEIIEEGFINSRNVNFSLMGIIIMIVLAIFFCILYFIFKYCHCSKFLKNRIFLQKKIKKKSKLYNNKNNEKEFLNKNQSLNEDEKLKFNKVLFNDKEVSFNDKIEDLKIFINKEKDINKQTLNYKIPYSEKIENNYLFNRK